MGLLLSLGFLLEVSDLKMIKAVVFLTIFIIGVATVIGYRRWRGNRVKEWAKTRGLFIQGNTISGNCGGLDHQIDFQMTETGTGREREVRVNIVARVGVNATLPAGMLVTSARNVGMHQADVIETGDAAFDAAFPVSAEDGEGAKRLLQNGALRRQIAYHASRHSDFQIRDNCAVVRIAQALNIDGDPTEALDEAVTMAQSLAVSLTNGVNGHEVAEPPVDALARAASPRANMPRKAKTPNSALKAPARRAGPKKP